MRGVTESGALDVARYRRGAREGDPAAQNAYGNMYLRGEGVRRDLVLAYMWLFLASDNNDEARARLEELESEGSITAAQIEEALRRAEICRASDFQDCE